MKILIPMAGRGKRFEDAGYSFPKPLIAINGKTMIQIIIENLNFSAEHILICQKEHYEKYALKELLDLITPNCKIIQVSEITEGAACTALLSKESINNDEELIIANSDQWVNWNNQHFLSFLRDNDADGGIVTFYSTHPKWSFVKLDDEGKVSTVAEKKPISNIATVGIYYFKKGKYFVDSATKMIDNNERSINGEFYIGPSFNSMIEKGLKVGIYHIPNYQHHAVGTPDDLREYIRNESK